MGGSMNMSMSHGSASSSVGGMTMSAAHGATNILPNWLAVLWTIAFIVVLVIHTRHLRDTRGQQRVWHSGHVVMALGMAFMFAPGSLDHFNIPAGFWQLAFANGAIAVVLWIVYEAFAGRSVNLLWLLLAVDFGGMAYMWSPSGYVAPLTWLLVAYFTIESLLWASNRMRRLDHLTLLKGRLEVGPGGTAAIAAAEPLVCFRDLRGSMFVMTIGMAYMLAAMQLLM